VSIVTLFRIREAADLLGVSDDTVRRWADVGRLPTTRDGAARRPIECAALVRFAEDVAQRLSRQRHDRWSRAKATNVVIEVPAQR
jgi:excisionase family DNA binding protein